LLLMDVETRRFELLSLEANSHKAFVADVLSQIPISASEEASRRQNYTGIIRLDGGLEMDPSCLLSHFCTGNEVLVAIPEGVPSDDCARLARPCVSTKKAIDIVSHLF